MKEKRDILFLCQFFYPEYISSATLPYDTAKALSENGFSVSAMCGYPKEYAQERHVPLKETVEKIQIKRLKYTQTGRKSFIGRLVNYFSFTSKVFFHLSYCRKFKTIVLYSNPPILLSAAFLAKKLYGCRLVFVAYDIYPEIATRTGAIGEHGIICKIMNYINRKFYSAVDIVVALSNEMKRFVVENRDIDAEKISVIPNWYADNGKVVNSAEENNVFYSRFYDKTVISYLGNMGTCQDMDTILDVACMCKTDARFFFLIAGHGNKVEKVREFIAENNLNNVLLLDYLHEKEYLDALRISTYAVVSLASGLNGLCVPSKTYAYMMSNLSLIAIIDSDSDIARDIIESKSGIVVNNGESKKILDYLQNNISQSNLRNIYLNKYEKNICLNQYISLFKNKI